MLLVFSAGVDYGALAAFWAGGFGFSCKGLGFERLGLQI